MRAKDYEPDVKHSLFLICPQFLQECSFDLLLFPNICKGFINYLYVMIFCNIVFGDT